MISLRVQPSHRTLRPVGEGPVLYWMSRDQRVDDNWALEYARSFNKPVYVVFCVLSQYEFSSTRHFSFMLKGLEETALRFEQLNIPFILRVGKFSDVLPKVCDELNPSLVVTDFSPLKTSLRAKQLVQQKLNCPLVVVDTHNIVPVWETSSKLEYAARTIRPKILSKLEVFLYRTTTLDNTPQKPVHKKVYSETASKVLSSLKLSRSPESVNWIVPGSSEAKKQLSIFISTVLPRYKQLKNDPTESGVSNLSPYLHFGQLSSQRVAIEINNSSNLNAKQELESKESFLEELIVRKELSDNYCLHQPDYDSVKGAPTWAQKTLEKHRKDKREYLYDLDAFEHARTHDRVWNAAQQQLLQTGKMHGYMRMYWAKKILEWSSSAEEAYKIAILLNDKYELDGRDPNGYTGIAWSLGGVHDRPWFERPIFGLVRYMALSGLARKFDVEKYISTWSS